MMNKGQDIRRSKSTKTKVLKTRYFFMLGVESLQQLLSKVARSEQFGDEVESSAFSVDPGGIEPDYGVMIEAL